MGILKYHRLNIKKQTLPGTSHEPDRVCFLICVNYTEKATRTMFLPDFSDSFFSSSEI